MKKSVICLTYLFCIFTIAHIPVHGKAPSVNGNQLHDELRRFQQTNVFESFVHAGASGIVKERMQLMKSYGRSMKSINAAIRNQSAESNSIIRTEATKMVKTTGKLLNLFPIGSGGGVSEASPSIWDKPGEFVQMINTFTQAVRELAEASNLNSQALQIKSFRRVGGACKGCHQDFREKKRH